MRRSFASSHVPFGGRRSLPFGEFLSLRPLDAIDTTRVLRHEGRRRLLAHALFTLADWAGRGLAPASRVHNVAEGNHEGARHEAYCNGPACRFRHGDECRHRAEY